MVVDNRPTFYKIRQVLKFWMLRNYYLNFKLSYCVSCIVFCSFQLCSFRGSRFWDSVNSRPHNVQPGSEASVFLQSLWKNPISCGYLMQKRKQMGNMSSLSSAEAVGGRVAPCLQPLLLPSPTQAKRKAVGLARGSQEVLSPGETVLKGMIAQVKECSWHMLCPGNSPPWMAVILHRGRRKY